MRSLSVGTFLPRGHHRDDVKPGSLPLLITLDSEVLAAAAGFRKTPQEPVLVLSALGVAPSPLGEPWLLSLP